MPQAAFAPRVALHNHILALARILDPGRLASRIGQLVNNFVG